MATARRTGDRREVAAAKDETQENALDQPAQQEEGDARGRRRMPERMPQWRTGNPNNSGIAGGIMRRVEERWQEEHEQDKKKQK